MKITKNKVKNYKKLKCGIIGWKHCRNFDDPSNYLIRTHAKAFKVHKKCELTAVFDIDLFKVKKFAQTWDVKYFYNKIEFLNHIIRYYYFFYQP